MNFEQFHNGLRILLNIEGEQLVDLLTPVQIDNFYSNPHMFFIRADDATARRLWDVMYPKPKEPAAGEAVKDAGRAKVIDLDAFRKAVERLHKMPEPKKRRYDYWTPGRTDFEYDTGKPFPDMGGTAPNSAFTYIVNGVTGDVTARAG